MDIKINDFIQLGLELTEAQFRNLDPKDQALLILEAEYLASQRQRNPLPFFVPNGKQEEFVRSIGQAPKTGKKIFISTAANGVGKTTVAVNIIGNLIWGQQTDWFGEPLFSGKWPYEKRIWYLSDHDAFQNKIVPEMEKWFPKKKYVFTKNGRKFNSHLESNTGWTLDCMTYDQSIKQFEAADVGLILYDEPPTREIRNACVARLRMGGYEIFVMTPLGHSAWIFDELIDPSEQKQYVDVHYASMEDACIEHGVRGHITHERIEYLSRQFDEDEREARLYGKPKHLSGKIFKMLHPIAHRHRIPAREFDQVNNLIYCAMDIHDRRPPAIIWGAANKDGKKYVVDEYPNDPRVPYHTIKSTTLNYKDFSAIIKQKEIDNGWNSDTVIRVIDPNYGARLVQAVGKTIVNIFADEGLAFISNVNDDILEGHAAIKDLLALDLDGTPNLKIGENCYNTFFQMSRYGIKESSPKKMETDGLSERIAKKYSDFPSALRYMAMVMENPKVRQASPKPQKPPPEHDVPPANPQDDWRNPFPSGRTTITKAIR